MSLAYTIERQNAAVDQMRWETYSGLDKGVLTKGVFSLEEAQESLKSLNSLQSSLENGWILLCFPHSEDSKFSRISRKWIF